MTRTTKTEREWLDELDRVFPDRLVLDTGDLQRAFGIKPTRANQLINELDLPKVLMIGTRKRSYTKTDIAKALARHTERKG